MLQYAMRQRMNSPRACGYQNTREENFWYPSPMDDLQKFFQRNLRRIAAVGAIFISLIAISALLNSSPHTSARMVKSAIPASSKITSNSVQLIQVNLSTDSNHFVGSTDQVIGRFASRALQPGDLLTVNDLLVHAGSNDATFLPIGIGVNDLPLDLSVGDRVDIYVIPKDQTVLPALVARHIAVQNIDQKSRALGGSVGVGLITGAAVTSLIVTAEAQGRLVLARDSF